MDDRQAATSRASEADLIRAAQRGDEAALDRLIERHRGFIVSRARAGCAGVLPLEDLIQEGSCGFLEGLRHFDCDRRPPVRLLTFLCAWIDRNIKRANQRADLRYGGARLAETAYYAVAQLGHTERELRARLGRGPTRSELVAAGIAGRHPPAELMALRERRLSPIAGDGDEGGSAIDVADPRASRFVEELVQADLVDGLRRVLPRLPGPQARYLELRYGLDGLGEREPREIRDALKVSASAGLDALHASAIAALALGRKEPAHALADFVAHLAHPGRTLTLGIGELPVLAERAWTHGPGRSIAGTHDAPPSSLDGEFGTGR